MMERRTLISFYNIKRVTVSFNHRYFCQEAWFNKQQHKKLHNHKNKWITSKSGEHLNDPVSRKIFQSRSPKQIRAILDKTQINHKWMNIDGVSEYHIYTVALRKLIDLQEFDECWLLFNQIKEKHKHSNLLCVPIYNTMIYLCLQRRNKYALKQALELYNEMTQQYLLQPDLVTFTNLISLCTAIAAWDKADNFWKILLNSSQINVDLSAYNTMIDCYAKSNKFDQAMDLFKQLRNSNMNNSCLKPDSFTYSILISALSKQKKVDLAEKLFTLALKDCAGKCEIMVYQPLLDAYSQVGDIFNCLKLFNLLLSKQTKYDINAFCNDSLRINNDDKVLKNICKYNEKQVFPKLNAMCFNAIFKGFSRMKQLRFGRNEMDNDIESNVLLYLLIPGNSWEIIDYLLNIMGALDINKTSVTYGILFHLCNYDACFDTNENKPKDGLQKAMEIYHLMRNDNNLQLRTDMEMCNFLRTALNVYSNDKEEKLKFVKWWIDEMDKMKLKKSEYALKEIVRNGINISDINIF